MDYKEARALMQGGSKIRWPTWWWGRYLYMEGDSLLNESGKPFPKVEFNNNKGWEIYEEEKHGAHNEKKDDPVYRDEG